MENKKLKKEQYDLLKQTIINHDQRTLDDIYKSYSIYKQRAFNYCLDLANKYNATYYGVLPGNCMTFSYGFIYTDDNQVEHICKITRDHDYDYTLKNA